MLQLPAYRAELSLHRLFAFEKGAMGDLFLAKGSFSWRGVACLYIPLARWAVFAAVVLTDVAGAAARFLAETPIFRRAGYAGLSAAILCTSFFFWAKKNWRR